MSARIAAALVPTEQMAMAAMSTVAALVTAAAAVMSASFAAVARAAAPRAASPMMAHKAVHRTATAARDQRNAGQQCIKNACHKRGLPFRMLRTVDAPRAAAAIVGSVPLSKRKAGVSAHVGARLHNPSETVAGPRNGARNECL